MKVSRDGCLRDETARFAALMLVWISLNAMGFTVLFHEPPNTMRDIIIALIGSLSTIFVQQVQYYNKTGITEDRQKDDTINKLTSTAATIAATTIPSDTSASIDSNADTSSSDTNRKLP